MSRKYYMIDFGGDAVDVADKRGAFATAVAGLKSDDTYFTEAVVYIESDREKRPIRAYWLVMDEDEFKSKRTLKHSDKRSDIDRVIEDLKPRAHGRRDPSSGDEFNRRLLIDEIHQWDEDPGGYFHASWFDFIAREAGVPMAALRKAEKAAHQAYRAKSWKPEDDKALHATEALARQLAEQVANASPKQIESYIKLRLRRIER